jgi:hypothetical protein
MIATRHLVLVLALVGCAFGDDAGEVEEDVSVLKAKMVSKGKAKMNSQRMKGPDGTQSTWRQVTSLAQIDGHNDLLGEGGLAFYGFFINKKFYGDLSEGDAALQASPEGEKTDPLFREFKNLHDNQQLWVQQKKMVRNDSHHALFSPRPDSLACRSTTPRSATRAGSFTGATTRPSAPRPAARTCRTTTSARRAGSTPAS